MNIWERSSLHLYFNFTSKHATKLQAQQMLSCLRGHGENITPEMGLLCPFPKPPEACQVSPPKSKPQGCLHVYDWRTGEPWRLAVPNSCVGNCSSSRIKPRIHSYRPQTLTLSCHSVRSSLTSPVTATLNMLHMLICHWRYAWILIFCPRQLSQKWLSESYSNRHK